jgi:hypothetical protein
MRLSLPRSCAAALRQHHRKETNQAIRRIIVIRSASEQGIAGSSGQSPAPLPKASAIPTPDEDKEVMHAAFLHAFQEAQPERARIPGMQEFASAILARARIPSQQYNDPLFHIFQVGLFLVLFSL